MLYAVAILRLTMIGVQFCCLEQLHCATLYSGKSNRIVRSSNVQQLIYSYRFLNGNCKQRYVIKISWQQKQLIAYLLETFIKCSDVS